VEPKAEPKKQEAAPAEPKVDLNVSGELKALRIELSDLNLK